MSPWSYLPAVLLPAFYGPPGPEPVLGPPARRGGAWDRMPAHLVPVPPPAHPDPVVATLATIGGVPPVGEVRFSPLAPPTPEFIELPKSHLFSPAEAAARELWARRFVAELTGVARGLGYGLFHGGSLIRDIDIVAVPWRQGNPARQFGPLDFVFELLHCLPLHMGNHGTMLFGHHWYALWHDAHRDHQIDLKVILPAGASDEDE